MFTRKLIIHLLFQKRRGWSDDQYSWTSFPVASNTDLLWTIVRVGEEHRSVGTCREIHLQISLVEYTLFASVEQTYLFHCLPRTPFEENCPSIFFTGIPLFSWLLRTTIFLQCDLFLAIINWPKDRHATQLCPIRILIWSFESRHSSSLCLLTWAV